MYLLGTGILDCPQHITHYCQRRISIDMRDAEIRQSRQPAFRQENIGWFDVPVNDICGMSAVEAGGNTLDDSGSLHRRQPAVSIDAFGKCLARDIFHHKRSRISFMEAIHRNNARVTQLGHHRSFPAKSVHRDRVRGSPLDLHDHLAAMRVIPAPINGI